MIWTHAKGFDYGQNITINLSTYYGDIWYDYFETELENIPEYIRINTTNLTMYTIYDSAAERNTYNIILHIDNVNILDVKKGIIEIKIN